MIQHINLMTKRRLNKGAVWLAVRGLGLVFVVLMASALWTEYQIYQLDVAEQNVETSTRVLTQELEKQRRASGLEEAQSMAKEASVMRSQIDAHRDWMDWIQKGELGKLSGPSGLLEKLAVIHEDGVWLQGVEISSGQNLVISGHATSNDALMRYANKVTQTLRPLEFSFSSLEVAREDPPGAAAGSGNNSILKFKLY